MITDSTIIDFANSRLRPAITAADALAAKVAGIQGEWNKLSAKVPSEIKEVVADFSSERGNENYEGTALTGLGLHVWMDALIKMASIYRATVDATPEVKEATKITASDVAAAEVSPDAEIK